MHTFPINFPKLVPEINSYRKDRRCVIKSQQGLSSTMFRFLILSVGIGLAVGFENFKDPLEFRDEIDLETAESDRLQVVQPLTIAAAVQAEVQRLQSLQEVFPPRELSYFTPYGDRTIISLRFPSVSKELLDKASKDGYGYGPSDASSSTYGAPKEQYGSPKPKYGPPKHNPKKTSGDLGVIIAQNYILRENIRDYFNFSKLAQSRPSNELVVELAKAFAERVKCLSTAFAVSHFTIA